MKKLFSILVLLSLLVAPIEAKTTKKAARRTTQTAAAAVAVTKGATHNFGTYLTTQEFTLKTKKVKYSIEYPVSGNAQLVQAMREYIKNTLNSNYKGSLTTPEGLLKSAYKQVDRMCEVETDIKVKYSTKEAVTLVSDGYEYCGGAHGMPLVHGKTFRVSDGMAFDISMLPSFSSWSGKVKQGLANGFNASVSDLSNILFDVSSLDYPGTVYLTNDGILLQYQPYEIAPYASGAPTAVIPATKDNLNSLNSTGRSFYNQ